MKVGLCMTIDIKALRKTKGLTQQEVADKTMISRPYYTILENRYPVRMPTVYIIKRIANVLDFDWKEYYDNV